MIFCFSLNFFIALVNSASFSLSLSPNLNKPAFSIFGVSTLSKIEHMLNEYIRESNNEYDIWLHNPDWKLLPTISFVDGYPLVLTCKYHGGGCNLIQILISCNQHFLKKIENSYITSA